MLKYIIEDLVVNHFSLFMLIFSCMSILIFIFLFLISKKGNFKKLIKILLVIPQLINLAENVFASDEKHEGEKKLSYVKNLIELLLSKYKVNSDLDFTSYIEDILSCPQKKGVGNDVTKKDEEL